jgi:DNA polymerase II small subunit
MADTVEKKKNVVSFLMQNNMLVTSDLLGKMDDPQFLDRLYDMSTNRDAGELRRVLNPSHEIQEAPPVIIARDYDGTVKKATLDSFVAYFKIRYKILSKMLSERQELSNAQSINRILGKEGRERTAIIGFVFDKQDTKNGNLMVTIEDSTGQIKVIFSKSKEQIFKRAKDLMFDEVVGIIGQASDNVMFGADIIIPDIPITHELKKSPVEEYAVVLSDIHVGSNNFLADEFNKCIRWLRGETGTEKQRAIAQKVRYVFIVGDMVDGVGIYPSQEKELTLPDINAQYNEFTRHIKDIPKNIRIIICPGNHDAVRMAEPQPKIPKDYLGDVYDMPNVTMISNPSSVIIGRTSTFPGFEVLMYHGYSYDYYGDRVESIRESGDASQRIGFVMRYLLQRRHLAPSYDSTQFIVDSEKDALVIDSVPDFFFSGHIHKSSWLNYRGVTLISGSCFQARTKFQEKVGHNPDPCRVPVVNLQTRDITVLNFSKVEAQ